MQNDWNLVLEEIASVSEQIAFLTRVATHANQRALSLECAHLTELWRDIWVKVTVVGKPENGAPKIANQLEHTFGVRLRTNVIETADYSMVAPDTWQQARDSAAIVWIIPSTAPLFDETEETIDEELQSVTGKLFVAIAGDIPPPESILDDVKRALPAVSVTTDRRLAATLEAFLTAGHLQPLLAAMRAETEPAAKKLLPLVTAYSEFLAMDHAAFARRLDYIRRDLAALNNLGRQAHDKLAAQSQAALAGITHQIANISAAMRQHAESVIQAAAIPQNVLASQDARNRLGREVAAAARAAGYREFDSRVRAVAMDLASARSVLLAAMDQLRDEAEIRLEEVRLNVGPALFSTLLQPPLDSECERPLNVHLDPGAKYAGVVAEALQSLRREIPDAAFSSNWAAGRIETMFRSEMVSNAANGWTVDTLDRAAATQGAEVWQNTAAREAGVLIGRIGAVVDMLQSGLDSLRLARLQIPSVPQVRAMISGVFSGYAARLQQMIEGTRSPRSPRA